MKKAKAGELKPDELKKQIEQRQKRAKDLEEQIAKADAELARLKALLDRGKQPGVAADSVIRLPNPRKAPKGIVPVVFACRHGRVMPADDAELVELAMKEIAPLLRAKKELDSKTLTALFNRKTIGTTYFRLRFRVIGGYPYLVVEHKPNTGTPTASLVKGPSLFRDRVNRLNKAKQYARFLVWGDSFDTYLAARSVADRRGLLAGWEPYDVNHEWRISLRGKVTLADVKPPVVKKPPPPKKPPAKPKEKPRPPLPTEQID